MPDKSTSIDNLGMVILLMTLIATIIITLTSAQRMYFDLQID